MSHGTGIPDNPLVLTFFDYQQNELSLTVNWNASNQNITGATTFRSPNCLYQTIYWGVEGANQIEYATIPTGTTNASAAQIKQVTGFSTILQVVALQIGAGP